MKKKIIVIIFLILILAIVFTFVFFLNKKEIYEETTEINLDNKFNVYKIHYYSNISTLSNETTFQDPEWNVDVYEYTDIAVYIERLDDYGVSNYIKNIYINNIQIQNPIIGEIKIYYLNPLKFGDSDYTSEIDEYEVTDALEYSVMNYDNSEDDVTYNIPIFFEDCSNPITLRLVNYNILENYVISTTERVEFNGNLLKNANIELSDIETSFSVDINIITEEDEVHTLNIEFEIPLKDEEITIFDDDIDLISDDLLNQF